MSRTLLRLRDVFDDTLFHRAPTGIIPTEKAEYLETLLPALLQGLDDIFSQQDVTPENYDKHFSLSLPSLMNHALFLPLVQEVSRLAPSVRLTEYPAQASPYKN
jgi:DNA-binding transcriptional LysR family regulator